MKHDEEIEIYNNGPLPLRFKERAYFPTATAEFALRKSDALEDLRWCRYKKIPVLGYDVWYATNPGPTVPVWADSSDVDKCYDAISQIDVDAERERAGHNADVVFNIWVNTD